MGKRGPKPTPTSRLKLAGSWRAETRDGEPEPEAVAPEPMLKLDGLEAAFDEWVELLSRTPGLLTSNDGIAIMLGVDAIREYVALRKDISERGYATPTKEGGETTRPEVRAMRDVHKRVRDFVADFGLSPAERAELRVPEAPDTRGAMSKEMFG